MNRNLPADPEARRQLLLTRIAFERNELRRDVERLREATTLPHLVRSALGLRPGSGGWFGGAASTDAQGQTDWLRTGLAWLRRYRLVSTLLGTLFGGAAPLLRKRGRLRWRSLVLLAAAAGGAAYWLWNSTRSGGGGTGGNSAG
jgi:hypothetical protein